MFGVGVQISPGEQFPLAYQIADPNDSTTYYIKSTVFNASTNKVIATIPLTDLGNGFFSKSYQVPPDPSGLGSYINVRTEVYLDSGFTQPSPNYEIDTTTYLVQLRPSSAVAFGGGAGGTDIDYDKIEKIIDGKMPKPKRIKELDRISFIEQAIETLANVMRENESMYADQMQSIVENMIESTKTIHKKIDATKFDPGMLTETIESMESLKSDVAQHGRIVAGLAQDSENKHEATQTAISQLAEALRAELGAGIESSKKDIADALNRNLSGVERIFYSKLPGGDVSRKNNRRAIDDLSTALAGGSR